MGETCCNNGKCGQFCTVSGTQAITESQRQCLVVRRQHEYLGFQPNCEEDGSFSEVQCGGEEEGTCWCVDVMSGQPVTEGQMRRPDCVKCRAPSGSEISVGEGYTQEDGCNTWQAVFSTKYSYPDM